MTIEVNKDLRRLLRWPEVKAATGICRSHAHALAAKNQFPKPIKLSPNGRASAWVQQEIQEWIDDRIETSRSVSP